jgi:1-acyl-sn-glycerol-3-phosphate acyltransferase
VSWFDILALAASVPGRSIFVAKAELRKVPLFGRSLEGCGHIFIDRRDLTRAVESLAPARRRLKEESPTIIMFPEGTRSATGELQPFKKGPFVLAIAAQVPVVPIYCAGTFTILPKGSVRVRPQPVTLCVGKPIPTKGLTYEDRAQLLKQTRAAVVELRTGAGEGREDE